MTLKYTHWVYKLRYLHRR